MRLGGWDGNHVESIRGVAAVVRDHASGPRGILRVEQQLSTALEGIEILDITVVQDVLPIAVVPAGLEGDTAGDRLRQLAREIARAQPRVEIPIGEEEVARILE